MKYLSLFSGIGGFDIPLNEQGHECIGWSEIDRYAIQVYNYHYGMERFLGDITGINEQEIEDFDLLVGGFPCQAFSVAGYRRGFEDTRGTLFFDIARILRAKQPQYCILENVKGLVSHDSGNTFRIILNTLGELGYSYQFGILNSRYFGVPQNRERIFIIGSLGDRGRPEVFPIRLHAGEISDLHEGEIQTARCLDAHMGATMPPKYPFEKHRRNLMEVSYKYHRANEIREHEQNSPTLTANMGTGGHNVPLVRALIRKEALEGDIRKLTPIECERLMGFPDDWTKLGIENDKIIPVSDTQRYKMLGNAVVTNVVRELVIRLC